MYPDSGAAVQLTGDLPEEGMQSGELENTRIIEPVPLVESPGIGLNDHGNEQNAIVFVIQRTWDTPGQAAEYLLNHPLQVPRIGRLRIRSQEPSGSVTRERWIIPAAIPSIRGTFDGCATTFRYQVIGGKMT